MHRHVLCAALIIAILVAACEEVKLVDDERRPVLPARNITQGRPDIPRSNPPQDTPDSYVEPAKPGFNRTTVFIPTGTPGTDLDVPLGDAIGKHHKIITQAEFPLLKHQPLRVDANTLVGYEETIRFDFGSNSTGRVVFGEDDEEVGTFLRFEEGKPILEYRLQLKQGTFSHYSGRDIQVLGHRYTIAEASNTTIALFGSSVASNLFLENGSKLEVNSTSRSDTLVKVTPSSFSFTLYVDGKDDGDILLSPNETLSSNIGRLTFGTDLMDIRYKGAPKLEGASIELRRDDEGYSLVAETASGILDVDLFTIVNGTPMLGDDEDRLRITQCGYCIEPGDRFIVTTPDGQTFLLRYTSLNNDSGTLFIREGETKHTIRYTGIPGRNASTAIIVGEYRFPVKIGPRDNVTGEHNISVEQGFRNRRVEIALKNGAILRIGDVNASVLPLQVVVPASKTLDRREQITPFNITAVGGLRIVVGNVTFVESDDGEDTFGVTPYGTLIHLERDDEDMPLNAGDDAVIIVPVEPLYGIVMLED